MGRDQITKIEDIVTKKESIDEDDARSLMILVRKVLDTMPQSDQNSYLTLKLFCNWAAHIEITQSNTGLRILAEINDTLVDVKDWENITELQKKMSNAIGFSVLRKELKSFFKIIGADYTFVSVDKIWAAFLNNLIEIIRDVPLSFPPLSKLDKTKQKIYNKIVRNPIKIGAGVISAKISLVKYPPPINNEIMCLTIKTEDTTNIVIPLLIDVRL